MSNQFSKIIYTKTDEAPMLATHSFLPIIRAFLNTCGVSVETKDISLASRILAQFPDILSENQKVSDDLSELGNLVKNPEANIIKLPNISASLPQMKKAISELQEQGFPLPDYPEEPANEAEKSIKSRYDVAKGSAVNPVLREGNSDRRAPRAVKEYARKHPHSMGAWSSDSKTHVSTMSKGDFFNNEQSLTLKKATNVRIELVSENKTKVLKEPFAIQESEIIDASVMSKKLLIKFLEEQYKDAKEKGVLFSLHLKATMMKVSDPIIFGHAVKVYFKELFEKYSEVLEAAGVDVNNGLGDLLTKMKDIPEKHRTEIKKEINRSLEEGPDLAMVNSDKGITNLHIPSDVIIDASMPAMIRTSGQMWNKDGNQQDTKAIIPDSSYAGVYQTTIDFCKKHGAFDPTTMGSVSNVGLMAKKAEEYGSHNKTFEIPFSGKVRVIDEDDNVLTEHDVDKGDIWRMCQAKDAPIKDWVELAVKRAKATGDPAIFWLDKQRAHDAQVIKKVNDHLNNLETEGLDIQIMSPSEATHYTLKRVKEGKNTISVTGNVLRDYLTDLFPILELGTSAKMLSIVPLMNGGGLFETGAGGSAPKHVQQLLEENHLRWDSLGEFLALAVSLEHLSEKSGNKKAEILSKTLDDATVELLTSGKSPSRKAGELDNRGSHFYLALYWAEALSQQNEDKSLKSIFEPVAKSLRQNEDKIVDELNSIQGKSVDIKGYYNPPYERVYEVMRPSKTFNDIISGLADK
ncbi:MAG: NADP-dependent isocitrate dehydrogenase [Brumimicrobium sp.]|nr:NADP-dependent isocitrate dehydrogenase [Brumimicrobium sp.]